MEDLAENIKSKLDILYPDFKEALDISEDYLDLLVGEVIDRALDLTNRRQLLAQYTYDLGIYTDPDDRFWINYPVPIPTSLETTLARTIIQMGRSWESANTATEAAVSSIKDQGQSISYSSTLMDYFQSKTDADMFGSSMSILIKYRIPTIIADSRFIQKQNSPSIF